MCLVLEIKNAFVLKTRLRNHTFKLWKRFSVISNRMQYTKFLRKYLKKENNFFAVATLNANNTKTRQDSYHALC